MISIPKIIITNIHTQKIQNAETAKTRKERKREREREREREEEEEEEMEMQAQANLGCAKPKSQRDPGLKPGRSATTQDPSLSYYNPCFCF